MLRNQSEISPVPLWRISAATGMGIAFTVASGIALATGTYEYGTGDGLSAAQTAALGYIDFSKGQSYGAMTNRFGYPDARSADGATDYFNTPRGRVAVNYDVQTGRATSVEGL